MSETCMSRRSFAGTAGAITCAGLLGLGMGGIAPAAKAKEVTWDEETDVVVVGCGGAGASAAMMAKDGGAEVIIFEKGGTFGSGTALCGQAIMGVGTKQQEEAGYHDTVDEALKYFVEVGDGEEEMFRVILEGTKPAMEWLEGMGCEFVSDEEAIPGITRGGQEDLYAHITASVPRTHWPVSGIWPHMLEKLENDGFDLRLYTPVTSLVIDDDGAVLGVVAQDEDGNVSHVKARRAVVLAAGGFSRDYDMKRLLISKHKIWCGAGIQDDGDGLRLGLQAGSMVGYFGAMMSVIYGDPNAPCSPLITGTSVMEGHPPFIVVNEEGVRFTDEGKFYELMAEDVIKQHGGHGFLISCGDDLTCMKIHSSNGDVSYPNNLVKADTLDDLAAQLGIDAEALKKTVEDWNAFCESGTDSLLGRTRDLVPLGEGPYGAAEVVAGDGSTFGGPVVDPDMHVISALTGEPIPHLYAAGQNSAALGRFYPCCGSAVATCIVTGRIAGTNAAAESAK